MADNGVQWSKFGGKLPKPKKTRPCQFAVIERSSTHVDHSGVKTPPSPTPQPTPALSLIVSSFSPTIQSIAPVSKTHAAALCLKFSIKRAILRHYLESRSCFQCQRTVKKNTNPALYCWTVPTKTRNQMSQNDRALTFNWLSLTVPGQRPWASYFIHLAFSMNASTTLVTNKSLTKHK